jgi:hypothetical protein
MMEDFHTNPVTLRRLYHPPRLSALKAGFRPGRLVLLAKHIAAISLSNPKATQGLFI